ncbi:MAG: efflux RND transporter permease subunit [Alphaproteobacteria bacterium]|nr:efflux RND transporter permease subunit [Alphaproteobacteria bacterium]
MLDRCIAAALRNPVVVAAVVLVVAALGVQAATRLPIDAVPDVTNVQVQVMTDAPGLGPLEVERFVTYPVEGALAGLPAVAELRSLSRFGVSVVTVVFDEGTDLFQARQLVAERLASARSEIPEGVGAPELGPLSSGLGEIFQFEVRGDGLPEADRAMALRDVLEAQIAPALRRVPGVVEVNAFGGELRSYQVTVTPERLASFDVSLEALFEALRRHNASVGGGAIVRGREQLLVRGVARYETLDDVAAVVVDTTPEGTPITVAMLGDVGFAPVQRLGAVTRDGRGEAVIGIAMMLTGANARVVAGDLRSALDALAPSLPDGVTVDVFYDRTELVDRTVRTVARNLAEGGALVVVVLLVMLGSLRGGLVVASAIPLSMLGACIGMEAMGVSANLMSLGAIDFGLVVDGSVVMIEHVVTVVGARRRAGLAVDRAVVLAAAREVAGPIAVAVGIITLVYVPILGLTGIEGRMFRPMAITVVCALAGSLVVALLVMPVLAAAWLSDADLDDTWLLRRVRRLYTPALDRALVHPARLLVVVGALLLGAVAVGTQMGAVFVPRLDEGAIAIQIVRPTSVSLEESLATAGAVERTLRERFPDEVLTVVSKTGRPEIATDPMGVDLSDVVVTLRPASGWTAARHPTELVAAMEAALRADVPGVNLAFSQPIALRTNELVEGVRSDVAVLLHGDDLDVLRATGDAVARVLAGVPGAADVKAEPVAGLPVVRVEVDRAAIARLGVPAADVLDAVATLGGRPVTEVVVGRQRFVVQVRFAPSVAESLDRIGGILVARPGGGAVPLDQVARVVVEEGPAQISHLGGQRRLAVEANVRGTDVASFVRQARAAIAASGVVPQGVVLSWGGQYEHLQDAAGRLAILVPLVLVLVFVLLQAQLGSVRATLLVYANVPLAVTGGVLALAARGLPLSISAAVGFIALCGIAVMNGVVLVGRVLALRAQGWSARAAAREGALSRLRPVLMTALVAGLGFLPMALGHGAGAEVQRPLATVVIGGLVTSTLLTLVVLPAVFAWAWRDPSTPDDAG